MSTIRVDQWYSWKDPILYPNVPSFGGALVKKSGYALQTEYFLKNNNKKCWEQNWFYNNKAKFTSGLPIHFKVLVFLTRLFLRSDDISLI